MSEVRYVYAFELRGAVYVTGFLANQAGGDCEIPLGQPLTSFDDPRRSLEPLRFNCCFVISVLAVGESGRRCRDMLDTQGNV
jgi:hypothetical protein